MVVMTKSWKKGPTTEMFPGLFKNIWKTVYWSEEESSISGNG